MSTTSSTSARLRRCLGWLVIAMLATPTGACVSRSQCTRDTTCPCRDRGTKPLTTSAASRPAQHGLEGIKRLHLGDGVHVHNYRFIAEYLQKHQGSPKQTHELERRQDEAMRSAEPMLLKPPSANIVESEFSHLLGAVARSNGAVGSAVFDLHGLKLGASGLELEPLVLSKKRLAAVLDQSADEPLVVNHPCSVLRGRASACTRAATRSVVCFALQESAKSCKGGLVALYRPVVDHAVDPPGTLGVSMVVVEAQR